MLDMVKLDAFAHRKPNQLSGGQQQRVALARAMAPGPKVLLLDEPLSALDLKLRQAMRVELKQLQEETGITFVFVTHDQEEALTMSDRITVMSEGEVQQIGAADEIYERPVNRFVADFIGETNLLDVTVDDVSGERCRCRLPGGGMLDCESSGTARKGMSGHLSIRPERFSLAPSDDRRDGLHGTLERTVYLGTDTQYLVRLEDGAEVTVRNQNAHHAALDVNPGDQGGARRRRRRRPPFGRLMAGGGHGRAGAVSGSFGSVRHWLLAPSWLVIGFFLLLPLAMMLVYSFLTKEFRGGVIWEFSLAAYDQFIFDRGLFGDEAPTLGMDLHHDFRTLHSAGGDRHLALPGDRFSDSLLHRHPT